MKPDFKAAHVSTEFAHDAPLITGRFDPTGKFVFAAGEDRTIARWELADAKKKTVFTGHDSWVFALAVSKDGQTLVSAGGDDTLIWWPAAAEKPAPLRKVTAHKGWIRALALSPDGKFLGSGGHLLFWGKDDEKPAPAFKLPDMARELDLHPDGLQIATVHHSRKLRVTKLAPKPPEPAKKA